MHTLVMLHLPNAHTGKVTFAKCTHFNNAIIDKMHTSVMLHLLNENSYSYGYMSQKQVHQRTWIWLQCLMFLSMNKFPFLPTNVKYPHPLLKATLVRIKSHRTSRIRKNFLWHTHTKQTYCYIKSSFLSSNVPKDVQLLYLQTILSN